MNPLNHVAIIMDGNGRWGLKYKNSRNAGHKVGLKTVEKIIKETIKKKIRVAAEEEEREFYENKAPKEWLNALKPLGTDKNKSFLEEAPYLIAIFEKKYSLKNKSKIKNYYVKESVGIATGILISCLHYSGLSMLTHTPSPMNFLNQILKRPNNEKPFVLLVIGKPKDDCVIPVFAEKKKSFSKITSIF